jgi:hypothetical protein
MSAHEAIEAARAARKAFVRALAEASAMLLQPDTATPERPRIVLPPGRSVN